MFFSVNFHLTLCSRLQVDMRSSLDKLIELEDEEIWKDSKTPEKEEDLLISQIHMDIWTVRHYSDFYTIKQCVRCFILISCGRNEGDIQIQLRPVSDL